MNIVYKSKKYVINYDWCSFSVKLENEYAQLEAPQGYRLELYDGNNIYKHRAILLDTSGRKLLTILWFPHSSILDRRIASVQISNECLYACEERKCLDLLYQMVPCTFNSFSRIDVAIDFEMSNKLMGITRKLHNGAMYIEGKQNGADWWHEGYFKGKKQKVPHCLNWGATSSKIKVKLYNKSREQHQDIEGGVADKQYIVDKWKVLGMDVSKVWRLEFSIQGTGSMEWNKKQITWDNYFNDEWLWDVLCTLYTSRFVVRKKMGKKKGHHNDDEIVQYLNLPSQMPKLTAKKNDLPQESNAMVSALRRMMKELEEPTTMANDVIFSRVVDTIESIMKEGNLYAYFNRTTGVGLDEYVCSLYSSVGTGVVKYDEVGVLGLHPSLSWD